MGNIQDEGPLAQSQPAENDVLVMALLRFRSGLDESQIALFSTATVDDVKEEIRSIQDYLGAQKSLRNMKRLSRFLEALSQLELTLRVVSNIHESCIWGPIKLALTAASSKQEALESLIDAFVEIGEAVPMLRDYAALFVASPLIMEALRAVFCDILEFNRNILKIFTRPAWKHVFCSVWKVFQTQSEPIRASMMRHSELLHNLGTSPAVIEIQESRSNMASHLEHQVGPPDARHEELLAEMEARYKELSTQCYDGREANSQQVAKHQTEASLAIKASLSQKLDAPDYEIDHQTLARQRYEESGAWIRNNKVFLEWSQGHDNSEKVVYLHGKPGVGKSIMVSSIIDYLKSEAGLSNRGPILFFYFRHSDERKRSMAAMLRALLDQLLYQDDTLVEHVYQMCLSTSLSTFLSLPRLKEVCLDALRSQRSCFLILDGLDECSSDEQAAVSIIDWFTKHVIPSCQEEGGRLHLLLSGQRDGVLDQRLMHVPSISMDFTPEHGKDIRSFAESKTSQIVQRFGLPLETALSLAGKVVKASEGMFLYAKLVLENLLNQNSIIEFEEELNQEFPTGLDEAYHRVVRRVLVDSPTRKKDAALKILRWVVCAARPLYWREIQASFCIDVGAEVCNPKRQRVDAVKTLCGSLIEVEPCPLLPKTESEFLVNLVHKTAAIYLVRTGWIDILQQHVDMALFSCCYLISTPFSSHYPSEKAAEIAISGYYALYDYTVASWHHHVRAATLDNEARPFHIDGRLLDYLALFLFQYGIQDSRDDPPRYSDHNPASLEYIQAIVEEFKPDSTTCHQLQERTRSIRQILEAVYSFTSDSIEDQRGRIFRYLQGALRYKCDRTYCHHFSSGFRSQEDRDRHLMEHQRPFKCLEKSCYAWVLGFASQKALTRHTKQYHPSVTTEAELFPSTEGAKDSQTLSSACVTGNLETVKRYIAGGVDVHRCEGKARGGLTPLVLAARNGQVEACRLLLQHGASAFHPAMKSRPELTAIGEAIKRDDLDLLWTLFYESPPDEKQAFLQGNFQGYIRLAVLTNSKNTLQILLIWNSSSPKRQNFSEIMIGIYCGRSANPAAKESIQLILDHEFPQRVPGYTKEAWYPSLATSSIPGNAEVYGIQAISGTTSASPPPSPSRPPSHPQVKAHQLHVNFGPLDVKPLGFASPSDASFLGSSEAMKKHEENDKSLLEAPKTIESQFSGQLRKQNGSPDVEPMSPSKLSVVVSQEEQFGGVPIPKIAGKETDMLTSRLTGEDRGSSSRNSWTCSTSGSSEDINYLDLPQSLLALEPIAVREVISAWREWHATSCPAGPDRTTVGNYNAHELSVASSRQTSRSDGKGIRKRTRDDDDQPGDEEEEDSISKKRSTRGDSLRLACPFQKKDPERHILCAFPRVLGFKKISHVKQHLQRRHCGANCCQRCNVEFETSTLLTEHLRVEELCELQPLDTSSRLSPEKFSALSQRVKSNLCMEGQWFSIWDLIFPGVPRPTTCTIDVTGEEAQSLCTFIESRGPAAVIRVLHENGLAVTTVSDGISQITSVEQDAFVDRTIGMALSRIVEAWRVQRSQPSSNTPTKQAQRRTVNGSSSSDDIVASSTLSAQPSGLIASESNVSRFGSGTSLTSLPSVTLVPPNHGQDATGFRDTADNPGQFNNFELGVGSFDLSFPLGDEHFATTGFTMDTGFCPLHSHGTKFRGDEHELPPCSCPTHPNMSIP